MLDPDHPSTTDVLSLFLVLPTLQDAAEEALRVIEEDKQREADALRRQTQEAATISKEALRKEKAAANRKLNRALKRAADEPARVAKAALKQQAQAEAKIAKAANKTSGRTAAAVSSISRASALETEGGSGQESEQQTATGGSNPCASGPIDQVSDLSVSEAAVECKGRKSGGAGSGKGKQMVTNVAAKSAARPEAAAAQSGSTCTAGEGPSSEETVRSCLQTGRWGMGLDFKTSR